MSNKQIRDFSNVIFQKKLREKSVPKQKNQNINKNILSKIDNEEIKIPTIPITMSNIIQQKRTEINLTQKDLAIRCNLPQDIIRDYENGKAIPKQSELSKINRILGTNLKIPKPINVEN